jgi:hypothetical protein
MSDEAASPNDVEILKLVHSHLIRTCANVGSQQYVSGCHSRPF